MDGVCLAPGRVRSALRVTAYIFYLRNPLRAPLTGMVFIEVILGQHRYHGERVAGYRCFNATFCMHDTYVR